MQNELDGLTATQQIRGFNNTIPIIGIAPHSSNSNNNQSRNNSTNTSDYLNYLSSGMNDLLSKPFTKQELYDKIHLKTTNNRLEFISNNLNNLNAKSEYSYNK